MVWTNAFFLYIFGWICKASTKEKGTDQYSVSMTQKPKKGGFRATSFPGLENPGNEVGFRGVKIQNTSQGSKPWTSPPPRSLHLQCLFRESVSIDVRSVPLVHNVSLHESKENNHIAFVLI